MTAPITALFLGGPEDGKVRTVHGDAVQVPVIEQGPYDFRRSFDYRSRDEVGFMAETHFRTRTYRRERIALFGRHLDVYVYDGVRGREERDGLAMRHLLSDVALGLVGGRS